MSSDTLPADAAFQPAEMTARPSRARLWFPTLLVLLYWAAFTAVKVIDVPVFTRFITRVGGGALMMLLILIWWSFFYRQLNWRERLLCVGEAVFAGAAAKLLAHSSFTIIPFLILGVPVVLTAWIAWLHLARILSRNARFVGVMATVCLAWTPLELFRMYGLKGNVDFELDWRWNLSPEERFLAERAKRGPRTMEKSALTQVGEQPGDWPAFRGPNRDGLVYGTHLSTDWSTPPKALWRQLAGPSWSSMIVIGERVFTQEQRGETEVVVCLDAATGNELWVHADKARHQDGESGAGPRGTPAYVGGVRGGGRIVALGGDGTLNCLDAATGAVIWTHDVKTDSGGTTPMWGFSASPLISGNLAIIFAGAEGKGEKKNLLAYNLEKGELAWSVPDGESSYTSPQPAVLQFVPQVLSFTGKGLISVDPANGKTLWEFTHDSKHMWRAIQPHPLDGNKVMLSSESDFGTLLLDVTHTNNAWTATERWRTRNLKASYNDYAIFDGYVYGFDGGIFCCIDAKTGDRIWKGGHYEHGQMLLLADQALILVLTERGEVVLLAATPEKPTEYGMFEAIESKTWNHPVLVRGRLFVRNAAEIACYLLPEKK